MRKNNIFLLIISLATMFGLTNLTWATDLAIYSGPTNPGWIADAAVKKIVDVVMGDARMKKIFADMKNFGDGDEKGDDSPLAKWTVAHTKDGQPDVIFLACGTTPSGLYPFPNKKPDGSNVEEFIDAGNIVVNVADWIFYMSYEGGVRSPDNGADGAANIFDIAGLSFASRDNNMKVNDNGKKYIPSMKDFVSDRPWHLEQFKGTDWVVTTFADAGGKNDVDPAVAVNKKTGGIIAAMWQKAAPVWPEATDIRGIGSVEFIANWLTEIAKIGGGKAVNPKDKTAVTWGDMKRYRQ